MDEAANIISALGPGEARPDILLIDNLVLESSTGELRTLLTRRYLYRHILFIDRRQQVVPL